MPLSRIFPLQISEHRNIPAILPNYFSHLGKVNCLPASPASTEIFLPFYRIISEGKRVCWKNTCIWWYKLIWSIGWKETSIWQDKKFRSITALNSVNRCKLFIAQKLCESNLKQCGVVRVTTGILVALSAVANLAALLVPATATKHQLLPLKHQLLPLGTSYCY